MAVLNEKLAAQRVAVIDKTAACDALLSEITAATLRTEDKKTLAVDKGKEAEDQSKDIEMEKVHHQHHHHHHHVLFIIKTVLFRRSFD